METPEIIAQWAHIVLEWIGFGTVVGLLAKAIMPGRDPGGAVATLMMGVGGTVIGCALLSYFWEGHTISPVSVMGFLVGTAGAFLLLFFYRLLGGFFFTEGETNRLRHSYRRSRARRRDVVYDEI